MSIVKDVERCIYFADRIGNSKKEFRQKDKNHFIHSHSQKEKVEIIGKEFVRFCRENYKTTKIHQIKEEHYRHFLTTKADTSLGHQRNIETALQQMQKGLEERAKYYKKEFKPFMTERLVPTAKRTEGISDRSYTEREIDLVKENVTENTKIAMEIMEKNGLRVSEACALRKSDIDFKNDELTVIVAKGGRVRTIPLESDLKPILERLSENMSDSDRFVKTTAKTVSKNCKEVSKQKGVEWTGTHGLRHTYARSKVDELMSPDEKKMFLRNLENYKNGKRYDYGVKEHERDLYNSAIEKADRIIKKLGHGERRFDLMVRYMY